MENNYSQIQELLHQRADLQVRLNLLPYDGSPEIKDQSGRKYLYIRKRVAGRLTSTYVGEYSDELYQLLLRNAREGRELKKNIRRLDKELARLGYSDSELSARVQMNLDFAWKESPRPSRRRRISSKMARSAGCQRQMCKKY